MPSFWTIGPMNTLPLFPRINRRSHLTHLLTGLAVAAATLLTVNAAFADVVTVERLRCETAEKYGDVHIYRAGKAVTSPNVDAATMGCRVEGPLGFCMSEPFKGSTPFKLRDSDVLSNKTTSTTSLCHTLPRSAASTGAMDAIDGVGRARDGQSSVLSAGFSKLPSITFVYQKARSAEHRALLDEGSGWQDQPSPGVLFKTVALADAHLKTLLPPVRVPSGAGGPPTPEQAAAAAREGLKTLGCAITPVEGTYACHDDRALKYCLAEGMNSGVAKVCKADFKADLSGNSATCKPFLGRADEQLCFEPGGFESCKQDVDAGKYKLCIFGQTRYTGKAPGKRIGAPAGNTPANASASEQAVSAGCSFNASTRTASCPSLIAYNKCRSLIDNKDLKGCGADFAQVNTGDMKTCKRFLGRADEMLCSAEDDYRECIQAVKAGQMKTCRMAGSIDSLYPPAKK